MLFDVFKIYVCISDKAFVKSLSLAICLGVWQNEWKQHVCFNLIWSLQSLTSPFSIASTQEEFERGDTNNST